MTSAESTDHLRRDRRYSRNPSEGEIAMYNAYFHWYDSYMPSQLDDINWLELWKHAWATAEKYHGLEHSVLADTSLS